MQTIGGVDSADRFDPWVSVDQKTGNAYVSYFSSESDPKNIQTAAYRLQLKDVLGSPQMVGTAFNPLVVEKTLTDGPYIGDHTTSDAFDSVYVEAWTQSRAGFTDGDVFAFVSHQTSGTSSVEMPVMVHSKNPWLSAPYPNPSNGKKMTISYYFPHAGHFTLDLFDALGRDIKHLTDGDNSEGSVTKEFDLGNISAGSYIVRMVTDNTVISKKLIVAGN